jgi:dihydropteroate synthase
MGILNITPDSFYSGSRHNAIDHLLDTARQMLKDGATILDIGGQSTRPGSTLLDADTELQRVLPVIEALQQALPEAILSIDTFYSKVAAAAVQAGAHMVNDISAGQLDPHMMATVAQLKVPYVLMHMKGTPQTMKNLAHYDNITREVLDYFIEKTAACHKAGINDVIIDPGFGFAKTTQHNFKLLKEMQALSILGKPLLAGLSRKATVYKTLHITPEEALNGTTVLNTLCLQNGAGILRVHDVKQAMQAIQLFQAYQQA